MLERFFRRNDKTDLPTFLNKVKNGERDFFKILRTPETKFDGASFDQLLSNEDDVVSGVNRVQTNFKDVYFNIFNGCLVKHHDNGDIKFIFYSVVTDTTVIITFADILFKELGHGYYKQEQFTPFTNQDKVIQLSRGVFSSVKDDIGQVWLHDDLTFFLQYKTEPLR
jgi:hypothetical protein